ncbi:hypothetical protein SKAU_G00280460 [Synaphobranchus kaupii]|uniref:HAT C-terminal dimerisation domain-containing protein n=1 Tax=Synaphobranchus kaupii TaxID=118154 RepID=A0A9Q1INX4_SYNKA|nr:hypothetical protein SKAU_G00280460 [Synaphobranchus kaupii]
MKYDSKKTGSSSLQRHLDRGFTNAAAAVEHYASHNHLMHNERDLLGWWREHNLTYPKLATIARGILSIPVSSSNSEWNFSVAGRTIDKRRTALKPSTVNAILFLHNNLK